MPTKQDVHLCITSRGEQYFQQMVATGYIDLPPHQKVDWNVLHDLILRGEVVRMSTFLTEGRNSILGRTFSSLSGREHGQLTIEGYGKTLRQLIERGYIKAYKEKPQ